MTTKEDEFTPLEARLASLRPRGPRLDRDRLMFLAGQASIAYWPERRRRWFGPLVLTASVAVAATTLLLTVTESASRIVDRVVTASTRVSDSTRMSEPTHESQPSGFMQSHPSSPSSEQVEYRIEVGNSLGMFCSFLIGRKPIEIDPERSSRSMGRLRDELLREGLPEPAEQRAATNEPNSAETEEHKQ